ncbi:MAG: hypothetical protein HY259_11995 [Chloroflexi bacterium]|nr:hypothetical protein [Chloroflexota bacterium]
MSVTLRFVKPLMLGLALALLMGAVAVNTTSAGGPKPDQRVSHINKIATRAMPAANVARDAARSNAADSQPNLAKAKSVVNRSLSKRPAEDAAPSRLLKPVKSSEVVDAKTGVGVSFDGLNHNNQRFANGGNQFSLEPPDQGLCVGNGYVFETVNDVLNIFDMSGNSLSGVVDLNSFYGYPPQYNRTTGELGPQITDPSCYYDPDSERWFHVVLTYDVDPITWEILLTNHLDIAVSQNNNPLSYWNFYSIDVTNDGLQDCPCLGDYPHIGADAYGFYITTNSYPWLFDEFANAQLYALAKKDLASGGASITMEHLANLVSAANNPGFTVWPAVAPAAQYNTNNDGTEYFLSSMATLEAGNTTGLDNRIALWTLVNTISLNSTPALSLSSVIVNVDTYGVPPTANQRQGHIPLRDCIRVGCYDGNLYFGEPESHPDGSDSRMLQVYYANGNIWGGLSTAVNIGGAQQKAGSAYYIMSPAGALVKQGVVALGQNNVTYPTIAALPTGKGIMSFTIMGNIFFPSQGYVTLDAVNGAGAVHVAAAGLGPDDGFTGYAAIVGDPPRTRWGDYGASVVDGDSIWIATEYIGQNCDFPTYFNDYTCGGTRSFYANWGTRITQVNP